MKTKISKKKIIMGLGLALLSTFAKSQGLEGVIVEKFYVANSADAANSSSNGASPVLVAGQSVTYRVYVDMAAGYKFVQLKGNSAHTLKIATTTAFYNDPNNGVELGAQTISAANIKKNTVMLDSYLTTGGTAAGKVGVEEADDSDGSVGNTQNVLQNNPGGIYGLPINSGTGIVANTIARDGMINGTPYVNTTLGFGGAGTASDVFIDNASTGTFSVTNGGMAVLGGGLGFGPSNKILIGQFTTDGVFTFELNVQLLSPTSVVEEYVANTPGVTTGGITEQLFGGLTRTAPAAPVVAIGGPSNLITGNVGTYTATAVDLGGTVTSVQFQVDGVNAGAAITGSVGATYSFPWTSIANTHTISLIATDNDGLTGTANKVVSVANNQAPTSTVAAVSTAGVGDVVTATVNSTDLDGTVVSYEFQVDGSTIGTSATNTFTWSAIAGAHTFRARATDNLGLVGPFSANANINVAANIPPTAAIVTPANGASYLAPAVASISATATDADGSVVNVVLLIDGVPTATVVGAGPYTFAYTTSTLAIGARILTVRSTDNKGAVTLSSPVTINVSDPNALPYAIVDTKEKCLPTTFCLPIAAASTYTVDNVIGYDLTLNYDKTKVTPTGSITVFNNLIASSFVETTNFIDNTAGKMNIAAFFKPSAPANSEFTGNGNLFCVEFTKTAGFSVGVDTAKFTVTNLQESYFTGVEPKLASNGSFTTYKDTTFNASLNFWLDNQPIKYDVANPSSFLRTDIYGTSAACVTNTAVAVQPDLNGKFTYNLINGQSIEIDRDILATTPVFLVVNGQDASIGKSLLVNPTQTLNIFQAIALDANRDGVISAGDVSQIALRGADVIQEFKQAWNHNASGVSNGKPSKDWVFVDSVRLATNAAYQISATFPADNGVGFSKSRVPLTPFCLPVTVSNYNNCPLITSENYKGIMVGDVNGSYAAIPADGVLKRVAKSNDKMIFDLSNAHVNGNVVDVPVSFVASNEVRAFDFELGFNQEKLSVNSVVENIADNEFTSVHHVSANDNKLRLISYSLNKLEVNQPIVSVRFNAENGILTADDFSGAVALLNGNPVEVEFAGSVTGVNSVNAANNAVSIYPNPTSGLLNVVVSENATVQLMDITGKQVLLQTTINAYENQGVNIAGFANGVYIMKVISENNVTVKKIVLSK